MKDYIIIVLTELANKDKDTVFEGMLRRLKEGYEIVHAISTQHSVFYILAKEIK